MRWTGQWPPTTTDANQQSSGKILTNDEQQLDQPQSGNYIHSITKISSKKIQKIRNKKNHFDVESILFIHVQYIIQYNTYSNF